MPVADHASNIPHPSHLSESVSTESHSRRAGELRTSACPPEPDKSKTPSGFSDTAGNEHVLSPDEGGDVKIPIPDSSSEAGATAAVDKGYFQRVVDRFSQIPLSLSVVTGHVTSSAAGARAVVGRISHRLPFGSSHEQERDQPGTGGKAVVQVLADMYSHTQNQLSFVVS